MDKKRFFILISLVFLIIWAGLTIFVNSKYFKSYAKEKILEALDTKQVEEVDFKSISINVLPFQVRLKEVKISYKNKGFEVDSYIEDLVVEVNFLSSFLTHKKYFISVGINEAVLDFSLKPKEKTGNEKVSVDDIKNEYFKFFDNTLENDFVLSKLDITQSLINYNDIEIEVGEFSLFQSGKTYYLKTYLTEILNIQSLRSANLDLIFSRDRIDANFVKLNFSSSQLDIMGSLSDVSNTLISDLYIKGNMNIEEFVPQDILKKHELSGVLNLDGKVKGVEQSLSGLMSISSNEFTSKYYNPEKLSLDLEYRNKSLVLLDGVVSNQEGSIQTGKNVEIYNFKSKVLFPESLEFQLKDISLKRTLKSASNVAEFLDAKVNGGFTLKTENEVLLINILPSTLFENLNLDVEGEEVLKLKELLVSESFFSLDLLTNKLKFTLKSKNDRFNKLNLSGVIFNEKINIKAPKSILNLSSFEHIAGFKIKGKGQQDIRVFGTLDKPFINFSGNLRGGRYAGFLFDRIKGAFKFDIRGKSFHFQEMKGDIQGGTYRVNGPLFIGQKKSNLIMKFKGISLPYLKEMHGRVFENIDDEYFKLCEGEFSGDYKINGNLDVKEGMKFYGFAYSNNLKCFGEKIDRAFSRFRFINGKFSSQSLRVQKNKARLDGKLMMDLSDEVFHYKFKTSNLKLNDLEFYNSINSSLTSDINVIFEGKVSDDHKMNLDMKLGKSFLSGEKVDDSLFKIVKENEIYRLDFNYMNNIMNLVGLVDLSEKKSEVNNRLVLKTKINHWKKVLGAFRFYPAEYKILKGSFNSEHKLTWKSHNLSDLDYRGKIENFSFTHPEINFNLESKEDLIINKGKIENFSLNLNSSKDSFSMNGEGNFYNKANFKSFGVLSAYKISKILNTSFNLSGDLNLNGLTSVRRGKLDHEYYLKTSKFTVSNIPVIKELRDILFDLSFKKNKFKADKFVFKLGEGSLKVDGQIDFNEYIPKIFINYEFDNGKLKVNSNSYVYLDGGGDISGKKPPYILRGDLTVNEGLIKDEFDSFYQEDIKVKKYAQTYKYMPDNNDLSKNFFYGIDLSLKTDKAIEINNSISHISMLGDIKVKGSLDKLNLTGRSYLSPIGFSKVFFNNNDIDVSKLDINFIPDEDFTNPNIDFFGKAKISDYEVSMSASGAFDELSFDFSSDPFLNKNDILSLMAFGYAEDLSERLDQSEREDLSSVGVGSFLFNQLNINKSLQKNLGLSVNINTEFEEDERSLLEGRLQAGSGSSDVRTTTKVEVKKNITQNLDLSLSSSILDETQQRQEMNLDYRIKKDLHLQGVYEINSSDASVEEGETRSVGADLKFQWTFE